MSIRSAIEDVEAFANALPENAMTRDRGKDPPALVRRVMRHRLLREEMQELEDALMENDVEGVADAYADMIYIILGSALMQIGRERFCRVWDEAQRSNMDKVVWQTWLHTTAGTSWESRHAGRRQDLEAERVETPGHQRSTTMKTIYVAGRFRAANAWLVEQNVRNAERVGLMVAEAGVSPVIPHANTRFFHGTLPDDFWLEATLAILDAHKALITVPDWKGSSGTKAEIAHCEKNGYPVFHTISHGAGSRIWELPKAFFEWRDTHAV